MEREYTEEEKMNMTPGQLTDIGVCPTCFDRSHNGCIFKSNKEETVFYQDEDIECFFVGNPRNIGHAAIATITHYHDMREAPDKLNDKIFRFAKKIMSILIKVYHCERVYMCTMCDGKENHYHVQLIPRYPTQDRGSDIFVKKRETYVFDEEKFNLVKAKIEKYAKKTLNSNS